MGLIGYVCTFRGYGDGKILDKYMGSYHDGNEQEFTSYYIVLLNTGLIDHIPCNTVVGVYLNSNK